MNRVLIVDGNSLGSRAFFVNPYEFFNMIQTVLNDIKSTNLVICFDNGEPNFRKEICESYKANRIENPERTKYINTLWKCLVKCGICCVDAPEGDDAVASAARLLSNQYTVYILSGDGDFLSLANKYKIITYGSRFKDRTIADSKFVKEKYGVLPEQLYDYKALVGEQGDGIPGCNGIGKVAAHALINTFGSLEEIYKNLDNNRYRIKLKEGEDMVKLSRVLVEMNENLTLQFSDIRFNGFQEAVKELRKCL